jgi:hypothetical protein
VRSSDNKDSRQKKVTFDTHIVDDGNDPDAIEIGSWGDPPLVQPTVISQAGTEGDLIVE